jgi:FkbM family methyltransferase
MTALLAARTGTEGLVVSFEPNPSLRPLLRENAQRWTEQAGFGRIELRECALSSSVGSVRLRTAAAGNLGTASVDPHGDDRHAVEVPTTTLDRTIGEVGPVGVMKLDVEGHEEAVITGGLQAFTAGSVRDVLVEEHRGYHGPVERILRGLGYRVFGVTHSVFGPLIRETGGPSVSGPYEAPSLLATRDEARARRRLARRGWRSLGR